MGALKVIPCHPRFLHFAIWLILGAAIVARTSVDVKTAAAAKPTTPPSEPAPAKAADGSKPATKPAKPQPSADAPSPEAKKAADDSAPAASAKPAVPASTESEPSPSDLPAEQDSSAPDEEVPAPALKGPAQLANSTIADALKLSLDQRAKIAALVAEREAALAKATESEKDAITAASDEKLLAVLTEVQRGDFLGKPVDKRLQFMFRYQPWEDVLEWFAEQAELSLVMNAPPPGTFNYTDTREYTPHEAIDLLNGVLTSKGFTLIRRGRMLMVMDLADGIPEGIVPRIELDQLAEFGKFEFVTVRFDLGRRDPGAVQEAIRPLLSPYGKLVNVGATRQLFVTDRAGIMMQVDQILQAIPELPIPPVRKPSVPEPSVLQVYRASKADLETVVTVFETLASGSRVVLDPKLKQINVYAKPSQHEMLKAVLEEMESDKSDETRPRLELYPIDSFLRTEGASASLKRKTITELTPQWLETLKSIVPDAKCSVDAKAKNLVAWATPGDHETIKSVLEKLGQRVPEGPQASPQLEVYRLTKVDPETTLTLLETILPDARLAVDKQTRTLVAVATPAEQEVIGNTLKTLQPSEPGPDTPELKFYELTLAMPPDFPEVIQRVAPGATVALDSSGMRLMVIATQLEHQRVERTIQKLQQTTFVEGRPKLVFYPVTPFQRRRFDSVWPTLGKELPGAALVKEGSPGELAIWARPHQHEVISEILEELKREIPDAEKFQLGMYDIKSSNPKGVLALLETLYPDIKFILDEDGKRLLVWTSQAEQQSVEQSLSELDSAQAASEPTVERYRLTKADPASTLALLKTLVPKANISLDARSEGLIAFATPADHQTIKATLDKLQPEGEGAEGPQLQFYPFEKTPADELIEMLQELAPTAKITVDADAKRLVVLASPNDQETIKSTLEQAATTAVDDEPQLAFYPFVQEPSQDLLGVLEELAPGAKITVDSDNKRLVVLATPADQSKIKTNFEQIAQAAAVRGERELKAYPVLPTADMDSLQAMLVKLYPDAEIETDTKASRLLVWAPAEIQMSLKNSLDELGASAQSDRTPRFESYPIHGFSSASSTKTLITTLQSLVPNAKFTIDDRLSNLIVWASPAEQEIVQQALERLGQGASPQNTPQLEVYRLTRTDPSAALALVKSLVPDAKLSLDTQSNNLIALAVPADHATIKATLDQLQPDANGPDAPVLRFHLLTQKPSAAMLKALEELVPGAKITPEEENLRLSVVATEAEHEAVKQIVEEFEKNTPPAQPRRLVVYTVTPTQQRRFESAMETLKEDLDSVQVVDDAQPGELAVWATPTDHVMIADLLNQLKADVPAEQQAELGVYTLKAADAGSVTEVIQKLFPDVEVVSDKRGHKLMIWAPAADQLRIKAAVEQMDTGEPGANQESFRVYTVDSLSTTVLLPALQELVPDAKLTADAKSGKILATATEADHKIIDDTIRQMQTGKDAQVVVYTVDGASSSSMIYLTRFLTTAVPNAKFSAGARPGQLVAWASAEDQQQIKDLVDQMTGGDTPKSAAVYDLQFIQASSASSFLQNAVPDAMLTADSKTPQRLTAWASDEDHDKIKQVLQQIDVEGSSDNEATARIYTIEGKTSSALYYTLRFLSHTVPEAEFTLGSDPGQIVAWATAKDHQQIQSLVDQLSQDPAELEVYTLKYLPAKSAEDVLDSIVPNAKITPDDNNPLRMTVMASKADHAKIKDALAKIDVEGETGNKAVAVVYQLEGMSSSATYYTLKFLASTFPNARFVSGAAPGQIVAWATPEDHSEIKTLTEQLGQEKPELQVYTLQFLSASNASTVLRSVAPKAKITEDAENPKRLTVWATKADHVNISEVLQKIDVESDQEAAATAVVYKMEGLTSTGTSYALRFLISAFPDVRFVMGAEPGSIVAWATEEDHQQIKTLVDQLSRQPSDIAVYDLQFITASAAQAVLASAVPPAKLTVDRENPQRLTAWATADDQAKIQTILEKIDIEGASEGGNQVVIYSLAEMDARALSYAYRFLTTMFPEARFSPAAEPGTYAVWATPKKHEEIKALVDQLTQPPPPERAPKIQVYDLKFISAADASRVLLGAVPQAKITPDTDDPQRMTVWAKQAEHDTIASILAEIDVEGNAETASTVAIYEMKNVASSSSMSYTLRLLATAFPEARFSIGTKPGQIVAWASAKDHEEIQALFDKLTAEPPAEEAPTATVYTLQYTTASSVSQLLRTAVPNASVTLNSREPQRLTVWASPADHAKIASILQGIDVESDVKDDATAAIYTLEKLASSSSMTYAYRLLTSAFPNATILYGAERGQFVAWATAEDHTKIKALVDQLNADPPPEQAPKVTVYNLQFLSASNASSVLGNAVPKAKVTIDTNEPQRMTVWATPDDHATIAAILKEIDVEGEAGSGSSVGIYKLEDVRSTSSMSYTVRLLTTAFPKARFSYGTEVGQIVAWASAKDHQGIKELFDKLNAAPPAEEAPKITVYTLQFITATTASQVLRTAVPGATVTLDSQDSQRMTVWATPEDHTTIAAILKEIDVEADPNAGAKAVVYQLKGMSRTSMTYVLRFLASTFPNANFTAGAQPGSVVAWATAEDHADIQSLVDQLEQEAPDIQVYDLQFAAADTVKTVLATAVPDAKITLDPDNPQRFTAWAIAEDHATIKKILEKIDLEGDPNLEAKAVVYSLVEMDPRAMLYAYRFLAQMFPAARFSPGAEQGTVVVWASPKDHEQIAALIEQITQAPPPERAPVATVYSLKSITAAEASSVLKTAVPQAQITPSTDDPQRMTIFARPSEHTMVAAVLKEIDVEGDPSTKSTAKVYQLKGMDSRSVSYALRFLGSAFPNAQFTAGAQPGSVVAWATAEDHADIQSLVDQLEQEAPEMKVYEMQFITAANAEMMLEPAVPDAELTPDPENPKRLTAWAIAEDHATIKAILEKIDIEADAESQPRAMIYQLKGMNTKSLTYALRFLGSAFPDAQFTAGSEPGTVVAWATPDDHEDIQGLVDQLAQEAPDIAVYDLQFISAAAAEEVLSTAVPDAELTLDQDNPQRFTAWAIAEDHATIKSILEKIDVEADPDSEAKVVIYSLEEMDSRTLIYGVRFLMQTFPDARFTVGAEPGTVVVWASAKDHEKISALIEQLTQAPPPERAPRAVVYGLKFITAKDASEVLSTAVPQAEFMPNSDDPQRLTAWARPSEHTAIEQIIAEIDKEGDPETQARAVVYQLKGMDAKGTAYALRFLASAFPNAQFTQGSQPGSVVAWANAGDHAEIESLVEQLAQESAKIAVYDLKFASSETAMEVLESAVPEAKLTADADTPRRFTAWAIPEDHETIKTILQEIDVETDPATQPSAVVYELEGMDSRSVLYAIRFLMAMFADARFVPGADPGTVVAWATAEDHAKIAPLVKQLAREPADVAVYTLKSISAASAEAVLSTAVPDAELTVDEEDPQRLTAWAGPTDQATIKRILEQIDVEQDPESAARVAIYTLESMDVRTAAYALRFLAGAFPDAKFTLGGEPGQLVVWAAPKDHTEIESLVKQLNEKPPAELARSASLYSLQFITAAEAVSLLEAAVPQASFSVSEEDPQRLTAWARPSEHETIASVLKEIDVQSETEPTAVVYTLESASTADAMRILREAVPQARLTIGAEPHQLIAWARPADHKVIAEMVSRMAEKGPDELKPKVVVYTIQAGEAENAIEFLKSAVPGAEFSVGADPRRLIAWARPAEHEIIQRAVDELATTASKLTTKVYRFRYADPQAAYEVLQTLVPTAQMAVDQNDQSLVVSGMPEDHQKIQATVDEMDRDDVEGQRPRVQIHQVSVGNVGSVYRTLYLLFRTDDTVQLSLDAENDSIIAIAPPAKHDRIDELIKEVEAAVLQEDDATMALYSMRNVDSSSAMQILADMLDKRGSKAELTYDDQSNQLIVIGKPEDHEFIVQTLEQLQGDEPVLEIYELQYVDPTSAQMAIDRQYIDDGLNGPQVEIDPITEQLFIRATPEQQDEIRDLLIKMGETNLALLKGRSTRSMRTISFQGDIQEAIREIQRVWPTLRKNEIRVVSPGAVPPAAQPQESQPAVPNSISPAAQPQNSQPAAPKPVPPANDQTGVRAGSPWFFVSQVGAPTTPADSPDAGDGPNESLQRAKELEDTGDTAGSELPPLYIVPGDGNVTVVCDDPAALQQFEQLLRIISPGAGQVGRNISVYELKYAAAVDVAAKLNQLYGSSSSTWQRGQTRVSIVADERLNTIVVQGSRIDRETIQGLINVMDSDQGDANKPQIVALKNADAEDVASVIRDTFRSQLSASTSRSKSSSSRYRSTSISSRFVPSIAVDEATNSLIIVAASPLLEDIIELATTLDKQAEENRARGWRIISLKKSNAVRVQETLQQILRSGNSSNRR